jgi:predicted glycosyltransferase
MKKILLYASDRDSIRDIHEMLAAVDPGDGVADLSVLVISGAPLRDGFRLGPGIYRVHLPAAREATGRADLIRSAVAEFGPDSIVVDATPLGVADELASTLSYAREHLPATSLVLVLRDAADDAAAGHRTGTRDAAVDDIYDRVLTMQ